MLLFGLIFSGKVGLFGLIFSGKVGLFGLTFYYLCKKMIEE